MCRILHTSHTDKEKLTHFRHHQESKITVLVRPCLHVQWWQCWAKLEIGLLVVEALDKEEVSDEEEVPSGQVLMALADDSSCWKVMLEWENGSTVSIRKCNYSISMYEDADGKIT
ncbi:hypothetical protein Tco_1103388 [Tanacetum coccineum]